MKSIPFTECVDLVGSRCKPFNGTKKYVSTGAVDVDQINEAGIEIIDYEKRPSRANLEASLGDVLFAKMQGTKKTLLINSSLVENIYSTGFCAVKAKKNVLTERCLYHLLTSKMFLEQKDKNCSGATQKAITNKGLQKVILHVPNINKQDLIAAQLDLIVKIITLRKQELVELDDLIKARFVEMFGDPIENPKNWKITTVGDIVTEVRYGTSKPAVEGGQYPYLRMNNLTADGHLDLHDLKYIDISDEEIEKCVVRTGDVLFNRTNSIDLVGKTALFDLPEEMVIAGYIIRVRLKKNMLPEVFSEYMNLKALKDILRSMAKGAVNQANINAQELQSIKIYLPNIELQKQFVTIRTQIDKSKLLSGCRLFHSWAPENRDKPKHVGVPRRRTKDLRGCRRQQ